MFEVYADVAGWPGWTRSVTDVRRLDAGPLHVGARARVRQPRLPVTEWTVTELAPGRLFTWEARGPGLLTRGRHRVEPRPGGCRVVAELEQRGPLGPLVALLTWRLSRRYLDLEVEGLRRHCENGLG